MTNDYKGISLAIVSGASFGLIPLFVIPIVASGMGYANILMYRFFFGSIGMAAMMIWRRQGFRLSWGDVWRLSLLSLEYIVSAFALFASYRYISSGISTSLVYTNPIWCALIGWLFLKMRLTLRLVGAIFLAFIGVVMLSGVFSGANEYTVFGLMLGLVAGLTYGMYLVLLPRLRLKKMPSIKFTFYVFFEALVILFAYVLVFEGGIELPADSECWLNLILLGLLPTAFSNICVTMALRLIDTTVVAVLGAFEPLTAMVIGILVLGEPYDAFTVSGGLLVIIAVIILTMKSKKTEKEKREK